MISFQSGSSFFWRWVAICIIVLGASGTIAPGASASSVDGTWRINSVVLEIFDCGSLVCGRIVWMRDPQRRSADCGRTIVWGLTSNGSGSWTDGSIFDPDDRSTYSLSATLQPDGTISARIYSGIALFGKTEILQRIPARSLEGWC
jgi:uncharacterized protein (DUF2147 family)